MRYYLTLHLRSDTTFGRGDGTAGLVDTDIEYDLDGLPFVGGRVIKGLLVEEYANLRFALGKTDRWDGAATYLFGRPGATGAEVAQMRVGSATLPPDLCDLLRSEQHQPGQLLSACTAIRRQTSLDAGSGAPQKGSLRSMRVLLRETDLIASLDFTAEPKERELALLAACVLAVRRGGTGRNRGRGRLRMLLHSQHPDDYRDSAFTEQCFHPFAAEVRP